MHAQITEIGGKFLSIFCTIQFQGSKHSIGAMYLVQRIGLQNGQVPKTKFCSHGDKDNIYG
jgi:hypothetical protein